MPQVNPTDNAVMEQFQRALAAGAQPINDYSHGLTALALSDRKRGYELADLAQERQFKREQLHTALESNLKLQEEAENNRIEQEAIKAGVETRDARGKRRSIRDITGDLKESKAEQGRRLLEISDKDISDTTTSIKEATARAIKAANRGQTSEEKLLSLQTTLEDPTVKASMKKPDWDKAMQFVLNGKGASAEQVQKATDSAYAVIEKNHFWPSFLGGGGEAQIKANSFLTTLMANNKSITSPAKQTEMLAEYDNLKGLVRDRQEAIRGRQKVLAEHGIFFPKAEFEKLAKPPEGSGVTAPSDTQQKAIDILKVTAPPAPVAAAAPVGGPPPATPTRARNVDMSGAPDGGGTSTGSFLDALKGQFSNPGNTMSGDQIQQQTSNVPIPATPQEHQAIKKMALDTGTPQAVIDQMEKVIMDPKADPQERGQAIYKWNKAITMYRANPSGNLPVPNMDFPSNAPIYSPPAYAQ